MRNILHVKVRDNQQRVEAFSVEQDRGKHMVKTDGNTDVTSATPKYGLFYNFFDTGLFFKKDSQ